jgi:hypothetical protein
LDRWGRVGGADRVVAHLTCVGAVTSVIVLVLPPHAPVTIRMMAEIADLRVAMVREQCKRRS